ncbi:MAG TPA: isoprenyl transferase [Candidatus Avacidaminococcus intestinavium]|uniref:Isoprenyl transferase n=1 Tax=Candidatus Avacidaminococcus intestinavium TaxID=2840684 RepID=A0A9D1MPW9_9FIRM|nr:isoprenyl transferase [Candidatus Avacidaminococcus intestinavium]
MWNSFFYKNQNTGAEDNKKIQENLEEIVVPEHIAVIMDGNGRWAKKQGRPRTYGHYMGAERLKEIVRYADAAGVKIISAYAFSTENWKRPITEVNYIMKLLDKYLTNELDTFMQNNVQLRFMGDKKALPEHIISRMNNAELCTKDNTGIILNLAINYGGRSEIINAIKSMTTDITNGRLTVNEINEENFGKYLYTAELPPPDLLIRTGGDQRVSNFMLWQIAYAEMWYTKAYWPDFTKELFYEALRSFSLRDRRFGGLNNK